MQLEQDLHECIHDSIIKAGYDPPDFFDENWLLDDPGPPSFPAPAYDRNCQTKKPVNRSHLTHPNFQAPKGRNTGYGCNGPFALGFGHGLQALPAA